MLEFLQERFTAGLSLPTLKVCGGHSAYHIPLGGMTVEKVPLVSHLLCGTLRLRPAQSCRHGIWSLSPLSCAPLCLEYAPGMVKAFLHPRPGYVPKVPANVARSVMLQAFGPPPFQNADQERHNLLCPVQALDAYVHRAALWCKNKQFFVCFGPPNMRSPTFKQRMSN